MSRMTNFTILGLVVFVSAASFIGSVACSSSSTSEPASVSLRADHEVTDVSVGDSLVVEGETDIFLEVNEPGGTHNPTNWTSWVTYVRLLECFELNVDWELEIDLEALETLLEGERGRAIMNSWFAGISDASGDRVCGPLKSALDKHLD